MLTPAAKRRRVTTANDTLKRPFRSPLVSRGPQVQQPPSTPLPSHSSAGKAGKQRNTAVNTTPVSTLTTRTPFRATTTTSASIPVTLTPLSFPKPSSRTILRKKPASLGWTPQAKKTVSSSSSVLSALSSHQKIVDRQLRHLDEELEIVRQAERLIAEAARKRQQKGGTDSGEAGGVTEELDDLTMKWRGAARQAAEELYPMAKERYFNLGGMKGIREMQRRQAAFFAGVDNDGKGNGSENGEKDRRQCGEEEEEDDEFNMSMMLRSMNVEFGVIGYDPKEERWIES